jgi:ribosomal protein S18 acetylase RimI-like enzyme
MNTQVRIRQATRDDLIAMEWEGQYTHFRRMYAEAYRLTQQGEAIMWVADLPGREIIGQVFVSLSSNRPELADGSHSAYIYGFRVRPAYQGQGIGSAMMKVVEKDLFRRGFRKITLNVSRDNSKAIRLYLHLGYHIAAADPGRWYYFDQNGQRQDVNEPAWRMEKWLPEMG